VILIYRNPSARSIRLIRRNAAWTPRTPKRSVRKIVFVIGMRQHPAWLASAKPNNTFVIRLHVEQRDQVAVQKRQSPSPEDPQPSNTHSHRARTIASLKRIS